MQKYTWPRTRRISFAWALIIACAFSATAPHPFYVGVTELRHQPSQGVLEISIRLFTDDLEKALARHSGSPVNLTSGPLLDASEEMLDTYLSEGFAVYANASHLQSRFLGYEQVEDAIWSHLECPLPELPDSLRIENRLLCELLSEQTHIVHLNIASRRYSRKLECEAPIFEWRSR
ncbi:MAG: hypothetical protein IT266_04865 [Saprospiraceae bacterium]|nr:hypothetical protein [Saprospiraceae bacterium]